MLAAIESDFQMANLDHRRMAMLRYAMKLTMTPQSMKPSDVDSLREAGFSDIDILHIAEVVAYYAYVNRIADGLGVALEGS
jgi:uncharacterized peroxidase-related enzyme